MAPTKKTPKRPTRPQNRPVRTSRADATSRAAFKNNGGRKHVWTLLQRNVNYLLLSEDQLHLEPALAILVFNQIFAGQLVNGPFTANRIRDDYASRSLPKRSKMYVDRICKRRGRFTREEIGARREAVQAIENVAAQFNLDVDDLRPINLGPPTDGPRGAYHTGDSSENDSDAGSSSSGADESDDQADFDDEDGDSITVTHVARPQNVRPIPPPPSRRIQRGVMDDGTVLPIGWQPTPDDWVEPTHQFYRDEVRLLRRVSRMTERHTRNAYELAIRTSTPSISSSTAGIRPIAAPVGPAAPTSSTGTSAPSAGPNQPRTHRSISQSISEPASDESIVLVTDRGKRSGLLTTIVEAEHEEEADQSPAASDPDERHDEQDEGDHPSDDSAPAGQMLGQRPPPSSFFDLRLPTPSIANSQPTAKEGSILNGKRPSTEAARRAQKKQRRDEQTQLIVNAVVAKPHGFLEAFLLAAFPDISRRNPDQAKAMTLTSPQEVDRTWSILASIDRPLFEFANSFTSSDSPLSPSYAPRLRMFHAVNIINSNDLPLLPLPERAILPTSELYRHGGPALRAYTANFASSEDIMACNPSFCRVCGSEPFDIQAEDLHSRPYVHTADLDWEHKEEDSHDGSVLNVNFFGDVETNTFHDRPTQVRRAFPVTYHDGVQRITDVCDPVDCEKCMFAPQAGEAGSR